MPMDTENPCMSEDSLPPPDRTKEIPFVTVRLAKTGEELQTNLAPTQRPLILWLLERAKMLVLTQVSEQEKTALVKPTNGVSDLLKRMGKG